jgi:cytochrome b561
MITPSYTRTAIVLHWAVALLIFVAFPLGLYMHELPLSPDKVRLINYHKWIGVAVFALVALRVVWRFGHRPPPLPDSMPPWQHLATGAVHILLYGLMIAVPVAGWLMSSAKGFQTVWFGVLPLPDLVGKNKELGHQLAEVHEALSYTMMALVALHLAAAVKHHLIDRDGVMARMAPWLRS